MHRDQIEWPRSEAINQETWPGGIDPPPEASDRTRSHTPDAVAVYKLVLANPGWTEADLAAAAGLDHSRLRSTLDELRAKRLLRPLPDHRCALEPVGPEHALADLFAEEKSRLRRERARIDSAQDELLTLQSAYFDALARQAPSNAIEVVPGGVSGLLTIYAQQAKDEMCIASPGPQPGEMQWLYFFQSIPSGQECGNVRLILDHSTRQQPTARRKLATLGKRGKEVRTAQHIPMWFVLFDRRTAVLAAHRKKPDAGVAVVRHRAVVESLYAAFELLWDSALPLPAEPAEREEFRDHLRQDILQHLAAGHKDEGVARRLGLSVRTCRRHIAEIMEQLGATNRFQAGVLAARQLLIDAGAAQTGPDPNAPAVPSEPDAPNAPDAPDASDAPGEPPASRGG